MKQFDIVPYMDIFKNVTSKPTESGLCHAVVTLETTDGGEIHVELKGQGRIAFCPWTSGLPAESQITYENAIEMQSANGHDVEVLKFLAAFSAFQKEQIDAEHNAYLASLDAVEVAR